ncbi:hypothetical protein F5148DRAFT_1152108 [Russula earlei]|uniref:Uncharacterized protein n=1 Tax=Russula earlei TaxID=71964 RepID=A0ACC0TXK1_9AGAM|nr:hypothetical protein F5148DRAFT_1152108 [Russula earlei]
MSTARAPCVRCQPVPLSCLIADSNVAEPALTSHCQSITFAQAKKTAETEEEPNHHAPLTWSINQQQDDNQSLLTSAPSPVAGTLTTASQAHSIVMVPPAIENSSENTHDAPQTNENGMYNDVNIMGIDSNTPTETDTSKNKKNQKADLEQFFDLVRHMKGDKCGQRQCKICA